MTSRYVVGIDLGTSNCAVACVDPSQGAQAKTVDLPVPQRVRPGELAARALLPSCVYLPAEGELPPGSTALPWGEAPRVVGELARWQGARVPGRVVTSAKSWLCHEGVDRQAPILPWGAPPDVERLSPVAAQAELLRHLARAWDSAHPEALLAEQEVVLTVPASFDEGARALTLQAARDAGLPLQRLTLLEEPQAAFYDFTARHRGGLAAALQGVRLVLVVDVGGGTTDFSLVQVALLPEGPALQRLAVGEHLLLGGDNMDAALARQVELKLFPDGRHLSAAQWTQAIAAARLAKESLLGATAPARHPIAVASGGSKLLGGTLSTELTREEVEATVTAGFFPHVGLADVPRAAARGALVELGLPFAQDAAITRHLVGFLALHAAAGFKALGQAQAQGLPRPDAILLNGGVFNSPRLTDALVSTVSALWPSQGPVRVLEHDSLDLAVARGAAYSGLARKALARKIGGGAPRAYYAVVGGAEGARRGVCLVPRGLEEGQTVELSQREFQLTLGTPVQFQLYTTTADRLDKAGELISLEGEEFKPLPSLQTILTGQTRGTLPVHLSATLTEVGTLALACVSGPQRWRLEFEVRGSSKRDALTVTAAMPARFAEAIELVERVYGSKPLPVGPKDVKTLARELERVLGPRDAWGLPILRELWTALSAGLPRRRRSADHERVMFHLLGYALRPGFGYPLDAWRAQQTFALFAPLLTFHQEAPVWAEFWILWRRIAGGLDASAQETIFAWLEPHLAAKVSPKAPPPPKGKPKGVVPQGLEEMVRCAASLELLAPARKEWLGAQLLERLAAPDTVGGPWAWAVGRLGARVPLRGAVHQVVSPEVAQAWVAALAAPQLARHDAAPFALAQLARRTGDRARDLDAPSRALALAALERANAPERWRELVREVVALGQADEARALGDTLPAGLNL